jgi:hypothetical protein
MKTGLAFLICAIVFVLCGFAGEFVGERFGKWWGAIIYGLYCALFPDLVRLVVRKLK